jgi:hypothetical protein
MLKRCYNERRLERDPCYIGCTVAPEWHRFSVFRNWMEKQNWQGMHLDKDFLTDSKVYGPDTCVFIPQWLNIVFGHSNKSKKQGLPIGVSRVSSGKFVAYVMKGRKQHRIGLYTNVNDAATAYACAKCEHIRSMYANIKHLHPEIINACERKLRLLCGDSYIPPA